MNASRIISIITGALVSFLAASAFVLSYDALHQVALANGITPKLAWLWPLTLDAVMIAASLAVLRNSLNGERAVYAWMLVGVFTVLSITFNTLHAPDTWLARGVFALPPAVVFLSFELLVSQVKSAIKRAGLSSTLESMTLAIEAARADLAELNRQADERGQQCDTLRAEIAELQRAKDQVQSSIAANDTDGSLALANGARQAQKVERQAQLAGIIAAESDVTYPEMAQRLGVSLATIKRDIADLIEAGKMRRNGHGLESVPSTHEPRFASN
ncbi:MAG: DUF2637 domain-containing protein [Thermoflexales bacterium]|nr:DUF2637 domain-containing protein [Thermoflexales bacterium]